MFPHLSFHSVCVYVYFVNNCISNRKPTHGKWNHGQVIVRLVKLLILSKQYVSNTLCLHRHKRNICVKRKKSKPFTLIYFHFNSLLLQFFFFHFNRVVFLFCCFLVFITFCLLFWGFSLLNSKKTKKKWKREKWKTSRLIGRHAILWKFCY